MKTLLIVLLFSSSVFADCFFNGHFYSEGALMPVGGVCLNGLHISCGVSWSNESIESVINVIIKSNNNIKEACEKLRSGGDEKTLSNSTLQQHLKEICDF